MATVPGGLNLHGREPTAWAESLLPHQEALIHVLTVALVREYRPHSTDVHTELQRATQNMHGYAAGAGPGCVKVSALNPILLCSGDWRARAGSSKLKADHAQLSFILFHIHLALPGCLAV